MGSGSLDDIKSATLDHIITWDDPNDKTVAEEYSALGRSV